MLDRQVKLDIEKIGEQQTVLFVFDHNYMSHKVTTIDKKYAKFYGIKFLTLVRKAHIKHSVIYCHLQCLNVVF